MNYTSLVNKTHFHQETQNYFSGRVVAVTGGSGFVGSHVVEQLLALGACPVILTRQSQPKFLKNLHNIEIRQCDLTNYQSALQALQGASVVLNLSAAVYGIEHNSKYSASIFQENMQMFFNTIKAAKELEVDRFLTTSSACVYPRNCTIPTPEIEGFLSEPEPTNSGYGWAKRMTEYLSMQYAKEFGLSISIARPYNIYGPRDNFLPKTSHVIPALIYKAFQTNSGALHVWGDGSHSRSFLYVDDCARGLLEVTARYAVTDPINIGVNEEITIAELAHMIAAIVSSIRGVDIQVIFEQNGLTGQPRRCCDTSKIMEKLNFKAHMNFYDGLQRSIEWYKNNENIAMFAHV